jgi:hypothetical protein
MKKWAATIVLLAALGVWLVQVLPWRAPSEADLRETAGVHAEVLATHRTAHGVAVSCRVSNTTTRTALHVVLRVALKNGFGQTLATNPLASVSDLAPGQMRESVFMVPVRELPPDATAVADVSLVRWK